MIYSKEKKNIRYNIDINVYVDNYIISSTRISHLCFWVSKAFKHICSLTMLFKLYHCQDITWIIHDDATKLNWHWHHEENHTKNCKFTSRSKVSEFDKYWYKSTLCIADMYCAHSFIHLLNSACTIFQYFLQQNFVLQH